MKALLGDVLTQAVMQHMQNSERQIELLNQMLDLVMDVYFDESPNDLVKMSRRERSEKVVPVTRTARITEDLAEAKKCLQHVFTTTGQVERYDQLLGEFIETTQPSEKKSDELEGGDGADGGDEGDDAQPALATQA
jgi:ferritin-like metal-binding protein YciE